MPAKTEKQVFYSIVIGDEVYDVTGRKRNYKGYVLLCVRKHPNSDPQGYVMEHRVVTEISLGRLLKPDEIVHHKNEIKHDNRLKNLQLLKVGEHTTLHHKGSKRTNETKNKISLMAKERFENRKNHPSYLDVDSEIKELIEEGYKPTYISKKLNISRKTVYNKIKYLGLGEIYYEHSELNR